MYNHFIARACPNAALISREHTAKAENPQLQNFYCLDYYIPSTIQTGIGTLGIGKQSDPSLQKLQPLLPLLAYTDVYIIAKMGVR